MLDQENNKKEKVNKKVNINILKNITKILTELSVIVLVVMISNIYNFKNEEYIYKLNNIAPKLELFSILLIIILPIYFKIFKKDSLAKKIKSLFKINIIFYISIITQKIFGSTIKIFLSNIIFSVIFCFLLAIILNKVLNVKNFNEVETNKDTKIKMVYNISLYYITILFLFIILKQNILSIFFKEYFIGVLPIYKSIFLALIIVGLMLLNKEKLNHHKSTEKNKQNEIKKDAKSYIKKSIITFITLAIIGVSFAVLKTTNILKEIYLDTTISKIYSLDKNQKEKLKKINRKTYVYIKNNNVKEDVDLILKSIEKENKNIIYLSGVQNTDGIKYKMLDNNIKKEIDMFLEKTKKENMIDKDYIYICPEKENGRKDVKVLKDPYRSNKILDSQNIVINTKIEILNALISSSKPAEKIGIINNLENIDPKDYSNLIRDLELYNYSFVDVDLNQEIPEEIKMIFCILPKKDLNEKEYKMLTQYMEKGGKLFLSFQSRNDLNLPNIDKIAESYGAKFKDVQILEKDLKNRYVYTDEKGQYEKFKKLEQMYKKGSSLGEIDRLQKDIKENEIKVNNDIIINELSSKSEITKKLKKENAQVITLLPGIITINNKKIEENNIELDPFIKTSENAMTLDKANPNLTEELNLDPYFKLAIDKGEFITGINLKKDESVLTILTSTAPILNYVKTLNGEYNFYNEKSNREVILNAIFKNLKNEYIIYDREYLKLEEEVDNNKKILSIICSSLICTLCFENMYKLRSMKNLRKNKIK